MSDEIQLVKDRIDLVDFINPHVPLKKSGRSFRGLCPFHAEKTPSFFVSPERQFWHCFGCGKSGDVFTFLMEREGLEFGEALRLLAQRTGVQLTSRSSPQRQAIKERLLALTHLASEFYHHLLLKTDLGQRARSYLRARHINEKLIKDFKLGYAPNSWDATGKFLLKRQFSEEGLLAAGLAIAKEDQRRRGPKWYDRFRGRLMFPIGDNLGRVVGFSARTLDDSEPKYINSPDSPIFQKGKLLYGLSLAKKEIQKQDEVILVEGNLDVISTHQVGFKNTVAPLGTGMTSDQAKLIKRFTRNLILAFDADQAGEKATLGGIGLTQAEGLVVRVARLIGGKDPDEIAHSRPDALSTAFREARPAFDFLLELGEEKFNQGTELGKRKLAALVLPLVKETPDEIIKEVYVKKLAAQLSVSENSVWQDLAKIPNSQYPVADWGTQKLESNKATRKPREVLLTEHFLGLLLLSPRVVWAGEEFRRIFGQIRPEMLAGRSQPKIWHATAKYFLTQKKVSLREIGNSLETESLKEAFDLLILEQGEKVPEEENTFLNTLRITLNELLKLYHKRKLEHLGLMIREAEQKREKERVEELKEEFRELSRRLR